MLHLAAVKVVSHPAYTKKGRPDALDIQTQWSGAATFIHNAHPPYMACEASNSLACAVAGRQQRSG
jgi:hypothetical protein